MSVLSTVITGTVLATGKTFTHGLGTTPDFVLAQLESAAGSTGASIGGCIVSTFNSQIAVIAGPLDGAAFRMIAMKIHSFQL